MVGGSAGGQLVAHGLALPTRVTRIVSLLHPRNQNVHAAGMLRDACSYCCTTGNVSDLPFRRRFLFSLYRGASCSRFPRAVTDGIRG